ncbi:MAG: methyltransferase domain-containing protein [Nitrosomonas sp.]|nr:methyltransferase domain-containing protein [Nitrosomonas sp.]
MSSTHSSFTGSIPEIYDAHLGPFLFEFSAKDLASRIKDSIPPDGKILEVACGTGISTYHLRQALSESVHITATDLNPAMLDFAKSKHANIPGVTFEVADALSLSFDDHAFDAVVCQFGIMFFPDKNKGLAEMARTLKPGGVLAFNVWDSLENNQSASIAHQTIASFFESDPPKFLTTPFGFYDIDHIKGLINQAGLKDIASHTVSELIEILDAAHIAKGYVEGNPGVLEINERATVAASVVTKATADALEKAYGSTPFEIEFQEIVFTATKPAA